MNRYSIFEPAAGFCGIAWNDTGLTGFKLPEDTEARTGQSLAARAGDGPGDPPAWVRGVIARVKLHLEGAAQDFSDTALDWTRVGGSPEEANAQVAPPSTDLNTPCSVPAYSVPGCAASGARVYTLPASGPPLPHSPAGV